MNPNDTHREQLSALIDGALDADQTRFLLRRLQHDGELADRLSRWQLAGDVLREQADAPAPAGFAEAIAARIADEPMPLVEVAGMAAPASRVPEMSEAVSQTSVARGARWRWFGGGAMAASLAIASVLALRPDAPSFAPTGIAATEITSSDASATAVPVGDAASNKVMAASAPIAIAAETVANRERAVSTAATPVRSSDAAPASVRVARVAPAPVRTSVVRERETEPASSRATLPSESTSRTAQAQPTPAADPFQPPAAKAWPRAVLPGAGNGTFNASLNSDASYYPFAPRDSEPADSE